MLWATVLSILLAGGGASELPPSEAEIRRSLGPSLAAAKIAESVAVDPAITDDMETSTWLFTSNFCYPGGDQKRAAATCAASLGNPSVLKRSAVAYFQQLKRGQVEVTAYGHLLAQSVGGGFDAIGWPERNQNRVAIIKLPEELWTAELFKQTNTGLVPIGKNARWLLAPAGVGNYVASFGPGKNVAFQVLGSSRQTSVLTLPNAKSTPQLAAEIGVPKSFVCFDLNSTNTLEMFNWGRAQIVESAATRKANLAPYVHKVALDITVSDATNKCDENCRSGLGISFAQSVATWRAGCSRCNADTLTVIRLGKRVWIDERLAARLRSIQAGELGVRLDPNIKPEMNSHDPWQAMSWENGKRFFQYYEISADRKLAATLCAQPQGKVAWLDAGQHFLCTASKVDQTRVMRPKVSFLVSDTACGRSEAFIACGQPNGNVEISMKNTSLEMLTPQGTIRFSFGDTAATVSLNAIVLHEVGHWFGVPHTAPGNRPDVMGKTLGDGPACVSSAGYLEVNNAADIRWPRRQTKQAGLGRPRAILKIR